MTLKHTFVSAIADDGAALAAGEVVPQAHWNADHTVSGTSLQVQYNNAGSLTGMAGTLWDNANLILAVGNSTTPTGLRLYNNVDTLSGPTNYERAIFDWSTSANVLSIGSQAGGTGIGRLTRIVSAATSGEINLYGNGTAAQVTLNSGRIAALYNPGSNTTYFCNGFFPSNNGIAYNGTAFGARNDLAFGWYNTDPGGTFDTGLNRQAAGTVSVHHGTLTNAAAFQVYNTSDVASGAPTNYERGVFDWTSNANTLTIGTQFGGTGSGRRVEFWSSNNQFGWKTGAGDFRMYLTSATLDLINGTTLGFEAAGATAGAGDAGLQRVAARVVSFSDGGTNANGWLQWGGQARVTGDFSVTSSTVLVNVTGLTVNVAAGRTYTFATELYITDAAAGGVQAAIAGTATATAIQYTGFTIADNAIKGKTNATALATAVGSTVTTETAGVIVRITGTITVNAAGTLTVQMAQNTSNGTATIAKRGSWFLVHDMP